VALINCLECDKQISDKADACPQCGCPNDAYSDLNLSNFSSKELWQKASLFYNQRDISKVIEICNYLISYHSNSSESTLAKASLNTLGVKYSDSDQLKGNEEYVRCTSCGYTGALSEAKLVNHGTRAQCPQCKSVLFTSIVDKPETFNADISAINKSPITDIKNGAETEASWTNGTTALYCFWALAFPIIGLIIGIYGVCNKSKRAKAIFLILFSIFSCVVWFSFGVMAGLIRAVLGV
jgi:phage FluMu protein Com